MSTSTWLSEIASGSFAKVYRLNNTAHFLTTIPEAMREDMQFKLSSIAVRIVKKSVDKRYRRKEYKASCMIANLPTHPHVLSEQVLDHGVSISRMYDESLHDYVAAAKRLRKHADIECVLLALAKGAGHLHQNRCGHFDIKPANILVKWSCFRGFFKGSSIVLADFGLVKQFERGGQYCGTWRGTKKFLCPEINSLNNKRGTIQLGDRIDIYAIGATMKEVAVTHNHNRWFNKLIDDMTDANPFKRPTAIEVVNRMTDPKNPSKRPTAIEVVNRIKTQVIGTVTNVKRTDSNVLVIGIISHHEGVELKTDTSKRDQSRVIALRQEFQSVFTMSIDRGSTFDLRYHLTHAMNRKGAEALIKHLDSNCQTVQFDFICLEYVRMPGDYYHNFLFGGLKVPAGCALREFVLTLRTRNKLKPGCKLLFARIEEQVSDRWSNLIQNFERVFHNVRFVEAMTNPLFKATERTRNQKHNLSRPYNHREELARKCGDPKPFAEFSVGPTPNLSTPSEINEPSSEYVDQDSDSNYVCSNNISNNDIDIIDLPHGEDGDGDAATPNLETMAPATINNNNDNNNDGSDIIDLDHGEDGDGDATTSNLETMPPATINNNENNNDGSDIIDLDHGEDGDGDATTSNLETMPPATINNKDDFGDLFWDHFNSICNNTEATVATTSNLAITRLSTTTISNNDDDNSNVTCGGDRDPTPAIINTEVTAATTLALPTPKIASNSDDDNSNVTCGDGNPTPAIINTEVTAATTPTLAPTILTNMSTQSTVATTTAPNLAIRRLSTTTISNNDDDNSNVTCGDRDPTPAIINTEVTTATTTTTLPTPKIALTPERAKGATGDELLQTAVKQIVHATGTRNKYRAVCMRLGVNLDANGKYMGAKGPVYTQLQQAVRKMKDSLKKNKMSTNSLLLQKNAQLINMLEKTKGEVQNLLKKNAHLTNMLEKTKDELQDLRASVSKKRKIPQMCSTNKKARSENDIDH